MLPRGVGYKQKFPIRCTLCTSRRQPEGKVFDMVSDTKSEALWFLKQHMKGQLHTKLAHERALAKVSAPLQVVEDLVVCRGVCFDDDGIGVLVHYKEHCKTWMSWRCQNPELRKHSIHFSDDAASFTVTHGDCEAKCTRVAGRRDMCSKCLSLLPILRLSIVKTALKDFGARLLFAQMYQSEEEQQKLVHHMKEGILYERHSVRFEKLLKMQAHQLQAWVRSSFLSIRHDRRSEPLECFLQTVVEPTLGVNAIAVASKKPAFLQAQAQFDRFLANPDFTELQKVNLSIAQASLSGRMDGNPLLTGLALTALRRMENEEAGITGAEQTRSRIRASSCMASQTARDLAREAGKMLSLAGGNKKLLSMFGADTKPFRSTNYYAELESASLPVPFLSIAKPEDLQQNMRLIDERLSGMTRTHGCYLGQITGEVWGRHVFVFIFLITFVFFKYANMRIDAHSATRQTCVRLRRDVHAADHDTTCGRQESVHAGWRRMASRASGECIFGPEGGEQEGAQSFGDVPRWES